MQADGEIVAHFLKDAANRRNRDARYDILLEIGYLLKNTREKTWCNSIRIGKLIGKDGTAYFAEASVDDKEITAFRAIVRGTEIEWDIYVTGHWRTNLGTWYTEVRGSDRAVEKAAAPKPRARKKADATGSP